MTIAIQIKIQQLVTLIVIIKQQIHLKYLIKHNQIIINSNNKIKPKTILTPITKPLQIPIQPQAVQILPLIIPHPTMHHHPLTQLTMKIIKRTLQKITAQLIITKLMLQIAQTIL